MGGPERLTFEGLLDILAEVEGIRKPKLHLPVTVMRAAARIGSGTSRHFPLTPDQLVMLLEDNVCDITPMRDTFGIGPAPLRDHLGD